MPRVGSRQASLNKLIWCTLLCYLLCSGDKIIIIPMTFSATRMVTVEKRSLLKVSALVLDLSVFIFIAYQPCLI